MFPIFFADFCEIRYRKFQCNSVEQLGVALKYVQ